MTAYDRDGPVHRRRATGEDGGHDGEALTSSGDTSLMRSAVFRFNLAIVTLVGAVCVALPVAMVAVSIIEGASLTALLAEAWRDTTVPVLIMAALMFLAGLCSVQAIRRRNVSGVRARLSFLAAGCVVAAVAVVAIGAAITG